MGTAELRDAFNDGAGVAGSASKVMLGYESHGGVQYQRLTFRGTRAAGAAFEMVSDRLRPETDVMAAAREMGLKLAEGTP